MVARRGSATPRADRVAVEEPMEVRVNGAPFAVIMRTPGADRDLAAGFLLAEDVIRDRKSTRLNSSHIQKSRMPSSA